MHLILTTRGRYVEHKRDTRARSVALSDIETVGPDKKAPEASAGCQVSQTAALMTRRARHVPATALQ
jgi:hypothetical protein